MDKSVTGFTIVELLIVIVVIAILAAISIVAYNGIQSRSYDSSIQNDLVNIAKNLEIQRTVSTNDSYPYGNAAFDFKLNVNKAAYVTSGVITNLLVCLPSTTNAKQFLLLAASKSGKKFYIENGGGIKEYTGGVDWSTNSVCPDMKTGWIGGGAGYSSIDTTTGPWRAWAGGN